MRKRFVVLIAALTALLISGGIAYASIPGPDGEIYGCYRTATGEMRVIDSAAECLEDEAPLNWAQFAPPGTLYDVVSVVGSYSHNQGSPDKVLTCPDSRVVISGWAFTGNDIPLPVVLNDSSSLSTVMTINVAGSGSGPWPGTPGQIPQGQSVFHGMICARVTS